MRSGTTVVTPNTADAACWSDVGLVGGISFPS
jgi:hypothetical protein